MCLPGLDKIAAISNIFPRNRGDLIKFWEEADANAGYLCWLRIEEFQFAA